VPVERGPVDRHAAHREPGQLLEQRLVARSRRRAARGAHPDDAVAALRRGRRPRVVELALAGRERQRLRQRQRTRRAGRRQLAVARADDHLGLDPPGAPQRRQRHAGRHPRGPRIPPVEQRPRRARVVDHLPERGLRLVEPPGLVHRQRRVGLERERHARARRDMASLEPRRGPAGGERVERARTLRLRSRDQRQPVAVPRPPGVRAERDIGQRDPTARAGPGQDLRVAPGHGAQRRLRPGRQDQQVPARRDMAHVIAHVIAHLAGHLTGRRGLGDDHVRVGPADPERAHARYPRPVPARPRLRGAWDDERCAGEPDPRVQRRLVEVQRDALVVECDDRLQHARHAGGALEVPEVGLDRAHDASRSVRARLPEHLGQRLHLDRVAERGAGAVGLDVADVGGRHAGGRQRRAHDVALGEPVGRGQPGRAPVVVHRRAGHERPDPVARAPGIGQPLEHQQGRALAARVSVGPDVERAAPPLGRQRAHARELDEPIRRQDQVDAAGQRRVALAAAQALARQVDRDQRRRAGGVDREARAFEPEQVRHAARQHAGEIAGQRVRVDLAEAGAAGLQLLVVMAAGAHEHPRGAAAQRVRSHPGVLQSLPGDLEEQPLLRIHARGLARRDLEELWVEAVDAIEEAAVAGVHRAGRVGVGIVERVDIPALARHLCDGVALVVEQACQRRRVDHAAGKPDSDPGDGDRLGARREHRDQQRTLIGGQLGDQRREHRGYFLHRITFLITVLGLMRGQASGDSFVIARSSCASLSV
jgi:hypothetical protein